MSKEAIKFAMSRLSLLHSELNILRSKAHSRECEMHELTMELINFGSDVSEIVELLREAIKDGSDPTGG